MVLAASGKAALTSGIENQNRALLREHFRKLSAANVIQPGDPPVNVLGGYRFPGAPNIELSLMRVSSAVVGDGLDIPDDLSIPAILRQPSPQRPDPAATGSAIRKAS
jgi:hypothetical protein